MEFNLTVNYQSIQLGKTLTANLYSKLHQSAQDRACWIRLSGVVVGLAAALIIVATRTAAVAENVFKGAINIVGSPFSSNCDFCRGVSQLLCGTAKHLIVLPFSIVAAAYHFAKAFFGMTFSPVNYTQEIWFENSPGARIAYERAQQAAIFQATLITLEHEPNNLIALKSIAKGLFDGIGVQQNKAGAIPFYERAAKLGDAESMFQLGHCFDEGVGVAKNPQQALYWYHQAGLNNHADAMCIVGAFWYYGKGGLAIDREQAIAWIFKAATMGHQEAMYLCGVILATGHGVPKNLEKAVQSFRVIARQGHQGAIDYLTALLFKYPQFNQYIGESIEWMQKANSSKVAEIALTF